MKRSPLAELLRPGNIDEVVGQQHLVGPGMPLRLSLERNRLHSMIFWGPPGVGKTTLARILAREAGLIFIPLSAISAGVKEVRQVIDQAKKAGQLVLFLDEIHRFNKAQQDSLLGAVENGSVILIGATTENPSFEVNSALLSRCQVYVLRELQAGELRDIIDRAVQKAFLPEGIHMVIEEDNALLRLSGGDARKLLNMLDIIAELAPSSPEGIRITDQLVEHTIQQQISRYDKSGDQHYDIISAYIKSIRGGDPNGALYWLARMIHGGEDPKFIARRLLILSSEDIGNANPTALVMANSCFQAVSTIGYPECRIILSQVTVYLACSPKSNASYKAIDAALSEAGRSDSDTVPLHIRNAPTKLMKELGYGKDYLYSHDQEGSFASQEYLPERLSGKVFYQPGKNAREEEFRKRLQAWWKGKYPY